MFSNHGILGGGVLQRELGIGRRNDQFEREADQVMRMPGNAEDSDIQVRGKSNHGLQRKCACGGGCPQCRGQRTGGTLPVTQPSDALEQEANRVADQALRTPKEVPEIGVALARARIHADDRAARSADSLNALAYTIGRDIVFGTGQFRPDTREGQLLLAHELAHVVQQETIGPMVQRCPRGQTLDRGYQLCRSLGGTTYESATGDYGLSNWDREHLRRWHGFYFIEASTTDLVTPPEVRRAAGPDGVLIPLSTEDLREFPSDPEQTVRRLVTTTLGITSRRITRSTEPDQRFATSALPHVVEEALTTGTEEAHAARERAVRTTQVHTLSDAARRGETLPAQELRWGDRMSPGTLGEMTPQARADWYVDKLGPLQTQLYESAKRHRIPMQLLAVVILNELADINVIDVGQSAGESGGFGSLGIAQIQVKTAQRHQLVDPQRSRSVAELLQVPQVAVEAAAREIEILLRQMSEHRTSPFQQQHAFTAPGAVGDAIYDHIGGETREIREANLARMVCAAYNSPDIVRTPHPGSGYRNAIIHGNNARLRAFDLYRFGLFRAATPRAERRARAASLAVEPITELRFDGSGFTVVGRDSTTPYPALSGLRPNNPHNYDGLDHTGPASQDLPDVGPIPEGSYSLYPTEIERAGFSASVWGPLRVRLHEGTLTGLRRRISTRREGGFFLHQDVGKDGTAGCIGLQSTAAAREIFARIARTEWIIPVTVEYTSPPTPMPARAPHRRPQPTAPPRRRRAGHNQG